MLTHSSQQESSSSVSIHAPPDTPKRRWKRMIGCKHRASRKEACLLRASKPAPRVHSAGRLRCASTRASSATRLACRRSMGGHPASADVLHSSRRGHTSGHRRAQPYDHRKAAPSDRRAAHRRAAPFDIAGLALRSPQGCKGVTRAVTTGLQPSDRRAAPYARAALHGDERAAERALAFQARLSAAASPLTRILQQQSSSSIMRRTGARQRVGR